MKLSWRRDRFRCSAVALLSVALLALAFAADEFSTIESPAVAQGSAAKGDAADDDVIYEDEVTEQFKLRLPKTLKKVGKASYAVRVTVTNATEKAIDGPLLLVVENLKPHQLWVEKSDGVLDSDEPFFDLVAKGEQFGRSKRGVTREIRLAPIGQAPQKWFKDFELKLRIIREDIPRTSPQRQQREIVQYPGRQELKQALAIQDRWTKRLMEKRGVVGTATGLDKHGKPAIQVFLETAAGRKEIPKTIEGLAVNVHVTGKIYADRRSKKRRRRRKRPQPPEAPSEPSNPTNPDLPQEGEPTDRFSRPVPIGVSTGNNGECSAGTIGCRVKRADGTLFALSNNHVLARENNAQIGNSVLQPGRVDSTPVCAQNPADIIGTLADFEALKFGGAVNTIDAAIATVTADNLSVRTPAAGYGVPDADVMDAFVGMRVQKYGRTTELTQGQILAFNVTLDVQYSNGTARFEDQIVVLADGSGFIGPGDSGSLLVGSPRTFAIGLLFAGSRGGRYAIANPIGDVLRRFDVTIDGQ